MPQSRSNVAPVSKRKSKSSVIYEKDLANVLFSNLPNDVTAEDLLEVLHSEIPEAQARTCLSLCDQHGNDMGLMCASFPSVEKAQMCVTKYNEKKIDLDRPMFVQHLLRPGQMPAELAPPPVVAQPQYIPTVQQTRELLPAQAYALTAYQELPARPPRPHQQQQQQQQQPRQKGKQPQRSLMERLGPKGGGMAPVNGRGSQKAAQVKNMTAGERKSILAARQHAATGPRRGGSSKSGGSLLSRIAPAAGSKQPAARSKAVKQRIQKNQNRMVVD